jgi:hypothetical protein
MEQVKFIKLTLQDERIVYFNAQQIASFCEIPKTFRQPFGTMPKEVKGSMLFSIGENDSWQVCETPEQIIELIKKL